MSDDLVQFLRDRLDDDERIARHAVDGPWVDPMGGPIRGGYEERFVIAQQVQRWNSQHIVRHDPARVLREVEAKRRILYLAVQLPKVTASTDMFDNSRDAWADVLKQLALPYADHPDYRDEWRPTPSSRPIVDETGSKL
ncbi:DUF6221 family protein [Streptomyces globisporus]|uniref:DUF6221 family protein n=1 Tax=Streptomyces globisporus TaxID=1908 RepID=UPI00345FD68B|nr:DUF6221 family protein [Streptomyces globisporus]